MMDKLKLWLRKKICCNHYNRVSEFMDLHRGMHNRETTWALYFRNNVRCLDCGKRWTEATPMPRYLSDIIDDRFSEYAEGWKKSL